MTLTSRYFGEIDNSIAGGGSISSVIDSDESASLDVRLVVADFPTLNQQHLIQVDAALDYINQLNERVRASIIEAAFDAGSIPGRVFGSYSDFSEAKGLTPEKFARSLRIASLELTPDGGQQNPDRVSMVFVSTAKHVEHRFAAIVREGEGLVFEDSKGASSQKSSISYGR